MRDKAAFDEAARYFPTPAQQFQFFDKYSRFDCGRGRRETWVETCDRAISWLTKLAGERGASLPWGEMREALLTQQALPSMRLLAMAGPAADRDNVAIYNCAYLAVDSLECFPEALLISMAGCGVGFSVERQFVDQLPVVCAQEGEVPVSHLVGDSAEGWAAALRHGLETWFGGRDATFDYSGVRRAGSVLKTKGGRASGPGPLRKMLHAVRSIILARQGQRLRPVDAHDIMCHVGGAAVSGGVRRTAMLSLIDNDDPQMKRAKHGDFPNVRWNANNSEVWPLEGVSDLEILQLVTPMAEGRRGENGIFSRQAAARTMPARRKRFTLEGLFWLFGVNPCGEIILRSRQFCNLSIAVCRAGDTYEDLAHKVRIAAIFGTVQSLATYFPHLRPEWKANCEEERLLGVDLTGQMDCLTAQDAEVLARLRTVAIETNQEIAALLGVNQAAAVTCNKPSGNSSQLLDCASGIHRRKFPFYIRNYRVATTSPVYRVLRACNMSMTPENGQDAETADTWVVGFPMRAPAGAKTEKDSCIAEQLAVWKRNKLHWAEHNPSCSITYRDDELVELVAWLGAHREIVGGLSFYPAQGALYDQPPYVEITEAEYYERVTALPAIDWSLLAEFEHHDETTAAQEVACSAGGCEI